MYLGYKNLITHTITMLLCDNKEVRDSVLKIYRYPESVTAKNLENCFRSWVHSTSFMLNAGDPRMLLAVGVALHVTSTSLDKVDWEEVHEDMILAMTAISSNGRVTGHDLCFKRQDAEEIFTKNKKENDGQNN